MNNKSDKSSNRSLNIYRRIDIGQDLLKVPDIY